MPTVRAIIQAAQPWGTPVAIIVAALLIGSALVGVRLISRYEISAVAGSDRVPMSWRIDTWTGDMELCSFEKEAIDPRDPFAKIIAENGGPIWKIKCRTFLGGGFLPPKK